MKKAISLVLCICTLFALSAECFAFNLQIKLEDGEYLEIEAYPEDTVEYIRDYVADKLEVRAKKVVLYQRVSALEDETTLGELGMNDKDKTYVLRTTVLASSSSSSSSSKSSSGIKISSKSSSVTSSEKREVINSYVKEENPNTGAEIYASGIIAVALLAGAAILIKKK